MLAALALGGLSASATEPRVLNALLDGVLSRHVDEGYVDYPAVARDVRFHRYIEALASAELDALSDDAARIAFWLNAYNALAIYMVTEGTTPVDGLGRLRFFRTTEHEVGGREYDLNGIAEILDEYEDPRLRIAMVDAAYSSPDLPSSAYRADLLESQLESASRAFVNDKRKNRFSVARREARLSELFERHAERFGDADEAILEFVGRYLEDQEFAAQLLDEQYTIEYLEFDWSINGRPM